MVGYLKPIPFYTYISYMISKYIWWITYLNEHELIFCSQLNGFSYL